jgi:hypothetical protein
MQSGRLQMAQAVSLGAKFRWKQYRHNSCDKCPWDHISFCGQLFTLAIHALLVQTTCGAHIANYEIPTERAMAAVPVFQPFPTRRGFCIVIGECTAKWHDCVSTEAMGLERSWKLESWYYNNIAHQAELLLPIWASAVRSGSSPAQIILTNGLKLTRWSKAVLDVIFPNTNTTNTPKVGCGNTDIFSQLSAPSPNCCIDTEVIDPGRLYFGGSRIAAQSLRDRT